MKKPPALHCGRCKNAPTRMCRTQHRRAQPEHQQHPLACARRAPLVPPADARRRCKLQVRLWEEQPSGVLSEAHDAALAHLADGVRACSVGAVRRADRLLARLQASAASAPPKQLVRRRLLFWSGSPIVRGVRCRRAPCLLGQNSLPHGADVYRFVQSAGRSGTQRRLI